MLDLTDKIEKSDLLERKIRLHGSNTNTSKMQYRVTIPKDLVDVLGWEVGKELRIVAILGSGRLVIEGCSHD